ncbi:MAG: GDSL-type esterase/lipase family protein [Candidatus Shapirobacteria bacterium]|nr:GDSL-type esterase/lipase family protein [Candidatus Shapirobacteria bacterium]MDD4382610.1 GDSL-type esterase/lipase family protein [Candidatus Shapirobacteria bacterium]
MFNKILTTINICLIIFFAYLFSKTNSTSYFRPTTTSSYYIEKQTLFDNLPQSTNTIYFLGDSLTDGCEWNELLSNPKIKNRGIMGDSTEGVLNRLNQITQSKPQKIFIMIGINDLLNNIETTKILDNYQKIITTIRTDSPKTKIYIESVLPLNFELDKTKRPINNQNISDFNNNLKNFTDNSNIFYIDLYSAFLNLSGQLNEKYTLDGIHLNGQGYLNWKNEISKYIK